MTQTGQVFELKGAAADGRPVWAYRYRVGGRGSRRLQRGGFESEQAAAEALERALARLRREQGLVEAPKLRELVAEEANQAGCGQHPEVCQLLRVDEAHDRLVEGDAGGDEDGEHDCEAGELLAADGA